MVCHRGQFQEHYLILTLLIFSTNVKKAILLAMPMTQRHTTRYTQSAIAELQITASKLFQSF